MFGLGYQELLIILVIVLILFGANRLPELARSLGSQRQGVQEGRERAAEGRHHRRRREEGRGEEGVACRHRRRPRRHPHPRRGRGGRRPHPRPRRNPDRAPPRPRGGARAPSVRPSPSSPLLSADSPRSASRAPARSIPRPASSSRRPTSAGATSRSARRAAPRARRAASSWRTTSGPRRGASSRYGAGTGRDSLIAVFVGTGVGSGAVLDGRLWRGASNAAGEVGHTQVVPDGVACPCGARGCLERYMSGSGFQQRLRDAPGGAARPRRSKREHGRRCRARSPRRWCTRPPQAGDPFARELWSDAVRYLTLALANYVTLLNPRVLVLGGGVIESVPALFESAAAGVPAAHDRPGARRCSGSSARASATGAASSARAARRWRADPRRPLYSSGAMIDPRGPLRLRAAPSSSPRSPSSPACPIAPACSTTGTPSSSRSR